MRILFLVFLLAAQYAYCQTSQPDAARIKLKLKKLNVLGSVLYVAAHPDDENTRVITKFANDDLYAAGYLSMTRGDGGQNLIGDELGDQLGVLRTHELLAARSIDGGEQFFTRAIDFGYSKSAEETLKIWGKEEILSDVVKVYRQFQPDIIITRFPPTEQAGHGHHTSSAVLAQEAFDLASNAEIFPEQVKKYGIWKPVRIFINTGRWWNNTINENTPGVVTVNVGGYSPLLGESFSEVAARSRSQHKSQGFGSRGVRGIQHEYLEFVKGAAAKDNPMEGINISWTRLKGGEKIQPLVNKAISSFDSERPFELIPLLLEIRQKINNLPESVWKRRKLKEVEQLVVDCLGLFIEVSAGHYYASPGKKVSVQFEFVNRSPVEITLSRISSSQVVFDTTVNTILKNNIPLLFKSEKQINNQLFYSGPFWLREEHSLGRFTVPQNEFIGKAANDPAVVFLVELMIGNEKLLIESPVAFKWTDPVKGELKRPFETVPPVVVALSDQVVIFNDDKPKTIGVQVKPMDSDLQRGILRLKLPSGWKVNPSEISLSLEEATQQSHTFNVSPPAEQATGVLTAEVSVEGKTYDYALQTIDYPHIPVQTLLPRAAAKIVHIDLEKHGGNIGYLKGAGDDVPAALRNMGYQVWEMKPEEVTKSNLEKLDAVVLGIRALNTNEWIGAAMDGLLEYVEEGGTVVVQYNTSFDLETDRFSPYELKISRERVTNENSEVRFLKPDHPVMNVPNKITQRDFEGWIQERGLYFPGSWSDKFEAVLSMNDDNDKPSDGSLLIAKYGKGHYIYTGLSFFRELPAGVPGAYRLFANIVSLGKSTNESLKQ